MLVAVFRPPFARSAPANLLQYLPIVSSILYLRKPGGSTSSISHLLKCSTCLFVLLRVYNINIHKHKYSIYIRTQGNTNCFSVVLDGEIQLFPGEIRRSAHLCQKIVLNYTDQNKLIENTISK